MKWLIIFLFPTFLFSPNYETHVSQLFIKCDLTDKLNYEIFFQGVTGYYNLKKEKKITGNILVIVDYHQPSFSKRFYVIDMDIPRVLYHVKVSHGRESGEGYAHHFSNRRGSHQSSLGFFSTGESYTGKNGFSLRLDGLDKGYNDNARPRNLVVHGAAYISDGLIGRSYGCLALPLPVNTQIIEVIKDGNCIFIYNPDYTGRLPTKRLDVESASQYYHGIYCGKELERLIRGN